MSTTLPAEPTESALPADQPTTSGTTSNSEPHDESLEYRALYAGSLLAVLLGLMSASLLLSTESLSSCLAMTPIPLIGIFIGLRSWLKIRRERDRYTGMPLAIAGLVLSLTFLAVGVGQAGYIYATEVPEGYERISFLGMKPSGADERASRPFPEEVIALAGEQVFIKGYIRPDSTNSRTGIDQFLLVRDDNQCCFGDLQKVKYFDQMAVKILPPKKIDYSPKLFRLGGTLIVIPQNLGRGPEYPVYALEADYVK